mmetsp:Transcript_5446/g.14631  ORF Transcript_5446/g.14631 Transcript_5446/m.14631 type:complete len:291 (+) Transcript_5446:917-1789(+)
MIALHESDGGSESSEIDSDFDRYETKRKASCAALFHAAESAALMRGEDRIADQGPITLLALDTGAFAALASAKKAFDAARQQWRSGVSIHAAIGAWFELECAQLPSTGVGPTGRCDLYPARDRMRQFRATPDGAAIEQLLVQLFRSAASSRELARLRGGRNVQLDQFDLHHAHVVFNEERREFAVVMHCAEHPQYHSQLLPAALGFCQVGSPLTPTRALLATRNVLFFERAAPRSLAAVRAAHPRARPALLRGSVATLFERDLGQPLFDVVFLDTPTVAPLAFLYHQPST